MFPPYLRCFFIGLTRTPFRTQISSVWQILLLELSWRASNCFSSFSGSHSSSESNKVTQVPFAFLIPLFRAQLTPLFFCFNKIISGWLFLIILSVPSVEPSSITMISSGGSVCPNTDLMARSIRIHLL